MTDLLIAENISKTVGWFRPETIVDRVSLTLREGEIMGLLGPNGAGKTTTMKMLLGLTSISSGSAHIFGAAVPTPASRNGVGFLPEMIHHSDHLSVIEYLRFHAKLCGTDARDTTIRPHLERVEMWEFRERRLIDCSKGMRQRVDIARLLLRQARLIFLDEPFSGLDPCGQVMLKDLLLSLKRQQIAILVNSHAAGILAEVCDRISIMYRGRLIAGDRLDQLLRTSQILVEAEFPDGASRQTLKARHAEHSPSDTGDRGLQFTVSDPGAVNSLIKQVMEGGGGVKRVTPVTRSLDQYFVQVISEQNTQGKEATH